MQIDTPTILGTASGTASFAVNANSSSLSEQNKNWILQAYANVSYELPGGYVVDPCRYSVVDIALNVSASWFNTTNYTFTPLKAGYWQITACYDIYRNSTAEAGLTMQKNGGSIVNNGGFGIVNGIVNKIVYMNGTSDNIKIVNSGNQANTRGQGASNAWFQARWLGN